MKNSSKKIDVYGLTTDEIQQLRQRASECLFLLPDEPAPQGAFPLMRNVKIIIYDDFWHVVPILRLKFYRVLKKKHPPPPHIGLYFVGNLIFICYILFYFI
ncbi:hypothetical protein QG077_09510 [Kingella kingae]|uniref:hypothetical protein n=1 Tax=Kingella kingae TaxID=504 RepID=UPI00254F945C|nr:hypothetical protein [Kingella kingae]MDK4597526.1 hypothetical protein [Kingella kingae]MDK4601468.1 hypothetical protein [Kingella kingae]MDK4655164.1 hypothetical protein [Kingella kingae]